MLFRSVNWHACWRAVLSIFFFEIDDGSVVHAWGELIELVASSLGSAAAGLGASSLSPVLATFSFASPLWAHAVSITANYSVANVFIVDQNCFLRSL